MKPVPTDKSARESLHADHAQDFVTNDYRANDSYAAEAGDVDHVPDPYAPMKTLARLDVHAVLKLKKGEPITLRGMATVGGSGLQRVEYWLRKDQGTHGKLEPDDPVWATAEWKPVKLVGEAPANWLKGLPEEKLPAGALFTDAATQRPKQWPLPLSWVPWSVRLEDLDAGVYEFRVRAIDLNGFAQPEPRPNPQSGIVEVQLQTVVVE